MMTDLIPGGYLYRTRIGSGRGALTYAWLEFLPAALALAVTAGGIVASVSFVICHLGVLALYEIGYRANDSALTSAESGGRAGAVDPIGRGRLTQAFVSTRLAAFSAVVAWVGWITWAGREGAFQAPLYALGGLLLLALLLVHTWVGARVRRGSPARWVAFGWLAALKPVPALLAVTTAQTALWIAGVVFLAYGAGRVVEYAVRKQGGSISIGVIDANACWFLAAAPVLLPLLALAPAGRPEAAFALAAIASHHLAAAAARILRRRPQ